MDSPFIKKVVTKLIHSGFRSSPKSIHFNGMNEEPLIFEKIENPVLYMVSIIDESTEVEVYDKWFIQYCNQIKNELSSYYCSRIVALTLIVDNSETPSLVEYVHKKEFFPGETLYNIWWHIDLQTRKITTGDGQPEKILDIQNMILSAFSEEISPLESLSYSELEKTIVYHTTPVARTSNTAFTYALIGINTLIFLWMIASGQSEQWISAFGVEFSAIFQHGEYSRLFTALFLHGNTLHLVQNCIILYFFGVRVELLYGKADMLFLYIFSGLGGSFASALLNHSLSIGASGAIFGLIGAILVYSHHKGKQNVGMNYSTLLLFSTVGLLWGFFDPNVDTIAHIGGFLFGGIISRFLLLTDKSH